MAFAAQYKMFALIDTPDTTPENAQQWIITTHSLIANPRRKEERCSNVREPEPMLVDRWATAQSQRHRLGPNLCLNLVTYGMVPR